MKLVIASGYFNPIRPPHIEYLCLAKNLGDRLIVIVNNDEQVKLKNGIVFMNESERRYIVQSLKCVDGTVLSSDSDGSVSNTIRSIYDHYSGLGYTFNKDAFNSITFAKGGDRFATEIPEATICNELDIKIVDGLGKKIGSSSELLDKYVDALIKKDVTNVRV